MSTNATFGRYRIGAALGQGGMATVHEAWIDGPDGFARKVALKRVRQGVDGAEELSKLFSDEARIASHLHHANLVGILDYGIEGGVAYQALELVDGTTLEALRAELDARREPLPEPIAIHVAREVAHGLAYAHRATDENGKLLGLVHRDVSPSNVLIGWNGDVKLSDFGIAFARGKQVETAHGVARGKPSYMAPEQATRGTIDARTDLFALGCTLHFALTGKSPLEGDEVLLKMLVGERAPVEASLPEDLRTIVAAAVSPERRERPASADVMNERLDAAYRARSSRDGRTELRTWLAPIAKRMRREPATEVVPTAMSRPALRGGASGARRFGALLVVLAALAAVVGGAVTLRGVASVPPATLAPIDAGTSGLPADASVAHDAASPAPDAPPAAPVAPPPTRVSTRAARDAPASAVPVAPVAPPASVAESGWIRVVAGCEAARGGAVALDGRTTGDHVPTTLRTAAGHHRVRVVAPDGTAFDGSVEVTAFHTEGSPAWFRACDGP